MKKIIVILSITLATSLLAQTKLIAHKSHSGKDSNFNIVTFSESSSSNFGAAPIHRVKNAKLDTLEFISANKVVMKTSDYCKFEYQASEGTLWKAGTDTLYNHPLFSKTKNVNKIKKALKEKYYFRNSMDSVVFIGYDSIPEITKEGTKQNNIPIVKVPRNPFHTKTILLIFIGLSLVFAFFYKFVSKKSIKI